MKTLKTALAIGLAASTISLAAPAQAQERTLGEVFMGGWNFCPRGSANAQGQIIAINTNQALFSLLGTTFGGDGRTSFGLPDLRGRSPMFYGTGPGLSTKSWGQRGGSEGFTLTPNQMPSHTHTAQVRAAHTATANANNPKGNAFARSGASVYETTEAPSTAAADSMHAGTVVVLPTGASQQVIKQSPYLAIQMCIATQGIFPSRN